MADSFSISRAKQLDISSIVELVNSEAHRSGAVLEVDAEKIGEWVRSGISLVAKDAQGIVIGHEAAYKWPQSGWVELRSLVVSVAWRGNGISSALTKGLIEEIREKFGAPVVVAFTNKAGTGHGTLESVGMAEIRYEDVPKELFTIGLPHRGEEEYGYKIYSMKL